MNTAEIPTKSSSFYVKDCALATIAIGIKAHTLGEFYDRIKVIPAESLYYHFWRQSMETSLVPESYYNDFSNWAYYYLHDAFLAERLALIDPSEYGDLEKLRGEVLEVVENRLNEQDEIGMHLYGGAFHFMKSKIVVFNTPYKMEHPKDLVKTIPLLTRSSIFYHFIDSRRREMMTDDFSSWLRGYHEQFAPLIEKIRHIDPYFIPLADIQQKLLSVVIEYFLDD